MLVLHYCRTGYEAIKVTHDIAEAWNLNSEGTKRLFYYDDFLGQSSVMEKLRKNEDQRILDFVHAVRGTPHTKLIMTTRETILQQAYREYEKLNRERFAACRPEWYTTGTSRVLGLEWTDKYKALTICLTEFHQFTPSAEPATEQLAEEILRGRQRAWERRGLTFPSASQLIQFHLADLTKGTVITYHCGVLFPRSTGGFMYLEKSDLQGPFLRIDIQNPADLLSLGDLFFEPSRHGQKLLRFVTANQRLLGVVDPVRAFGGRNVTGHEMWRMPIFNSWDNPVTMHSPDVYLDEKEREQRRP